MMFSKRIRLGSVLLGGLIASVPARVLNAQPAACVSESNPIATHYLGMMRRLVDRTDSVAVAVRARYQLPAGVGSAEVVAVTDPGICNQAATLYYLDRDGTSSAMQPVFVIRMRSVYYILEPALRRRSEASQWAIHSIVADSSLTAVHTREQSR